MLTVACNSITFLNSIAKLDSKIRFGGALTMASHVAQGGLGNKQGTTTHKRVGLSRRHWQALAQNLASWQ